MDRRIFVIMSVYYKDDVKPFENAVQSILGQTMPVKLVLYVDGVIGHDLEVSVCRYELAHAVHVIRGKENHGLAHALNEMIDFCLGQNAEFILRMDSDDVSREDRVEKQVEFMESRPRIAMSGAYCREFGSSFALDIKKVPLTHEQIYDRSVARCPFIHPTVIFRASMFESGLRYPENTSFTEDMALWFRVLDSGYETANLDEVVLDYCLREDTVVRRAGFGKAISEVRLRAAYMFRLKRVKLSNILSIFARFVFHLMPRSVVKVAYKNFRNV